jgi:hypothetical protein
MDVNRILAELRQEKSKLDNAINVLQELALGGKRRRGRPPAWVTAQRRAIQAVQGTETAPAKAIKKHTWSRAQRKAASERMKKIQRTKKRETVKMHHTKMHTKKGEIATETATPVKTATAVA